MRPLTDYRWPLVASTFFFMAVALVLTGCEHSKPNFIYMPDMVYSPALKAQKEGQLPMVAGTVPRGFSAYPYRKEQGDQAGRELKNPFRPTREVLARGQVMFNTYCIVCHGPNGEGDGSIVPKFPRPPSLQSDKIRGWGDGQIYHTITMGQGNMPSYTQQISRGDRWSIVHYVRALQRAKHPTAEDLKAAEAE
jgi:mono/diheme cytochrome c family protein